MRFAESFPHTAVSYRGDIFRIFRERNKSSGSRVQTVCHHTNDRHADFQRQHDDYNNSIIMYARFGRRFSGRDGRRRRLVAVLDRARRNAGPVGGTKEQTGLLTDGCTSPTAPTDNAIGVIKRHHVGHGELQSSSNRRSADTRTTLLRRQQLAAQDCTLYYQYNSRRTSPPHFRRLDSILHE